MRFQISEIYALQFQPAARTHNERFVRCVKQFLSHYICTTATSPLSVCKFLFLVS